MIIRNNAFIVERERGEQVWSIEINDHSEVVVLGSPPDESEQDDENTHNCDAMGCGYVHVLFRGSIVSEDENASLAVYPER